MTEVKILNQRENPLFNRKEVELLIMNEVTPKNREAEEIVAKEFSSDVENVKIKKISGYYGLNKFKISANIYKSKEYKNKIEIKPSKEKKAKA